MVPIREVTVGIADAAARTTDRLVQDGDARYKPDVIRSAVRRIFTAWTDAVLGRPAELMTLAPADVVSFLLEPPTGLGKRLRLVVLDPKAGRAEVTAADADASPPTLDLEIRLAARWWVEDPATGRLSRGYRDADTEVRVSCTLAPEGPGPGPGSWRLTRCHASTQEEISGYRYVTRTETPDEYRARTGDRQTPTISGGASRRYRISGSWADDDLKIGGGSTVDVELERFPERGVAEQLLVPIAEKEFTRWRPEADEFRPSLSSLQAVELLEPSRPVAAAHYRWRRTRMDEMTDHSPSSEKELDRPGGTGELAGRRVGRIGFGAMQLPGPRVFGPPRDRATALAVLRRVVDLGINHIDTAQYYGPDVSNELIHEALFPYPADLVLVSKVGAQRDDQGGWGPAQRPEQLRAGVEANLRSLELEQVDVVNLRLHSDAHGDEANSGEVDLDSQVAEIVALRDEGKIGAIGVSNVSLDQLRQAMPAGLACVQNAYSALDRSSEPLLDLCREHGVAWVPFFPLGSAFSWMPKVTEHPAVMAAATALGATPAQVGLAWLLGHGSHVLLIPGTASLDHLVENVAAGEVRLDAETVAVIDGLAEPGSSGS